MNLIQIIFIFIILIFPNCKKQTNKLDRLGNNEKELHIGSYPGYIEKGSHEEEFDWVNSFEKETGCNIVNHVYENESEIKKELEFGTSDLVITTGETVLDFYKNDLIEEINLELIPNWQEVDSRIKFNKWNFFEDKNYGVPIGWAPNILLYNSYFFNDKPSSWKVIFEKNSLKDNTGLVQAYDSHMYFADAILYLKHSRPDLEIQDTYKVNKKVFAEAIKLLTNQQKILHSYWNDGFEQSKNFDKGEVMASMAWPYQYHHLKSIGNIQFAHLIPEEGSVGWFDSLLLSKKAKNKNCAYNWMNHILKKNIQSDFAAWLGIVPVNPRACFENSLLEKDSCDTNGFVDFDRIHFWKGWSCESGSDCVSREEWKSSFKEIKNNFLVQIKRD